MADKKEEELEKEEQDGEEKKEPTDKDEKVEEERSEESLDEKPSGEPQETVSEPSGELIVDVSEKKSYGWLLIIGAIFAAIVLIGGLLFYYKGVENISISGETEATPTPTTSPSITLTPTPKASESAKVDREEFGIEILNGSGTSGEAAAMQELLEGEGFKVDSIGNADESDHEETEVSAKEGVSKEFLDELTAELKKTYVVSKSIGELSDDEGSDVLIIVGQDRAED